MFRKRIYSPIASHQNVADLVARTIEKTKGTKEYTLSKYGHVNEELNHVKRWEHPAVRKILQGHLTKYLFESEHFPALKFRNFVVGANTIVHNKPSNPQKAREELEMHIFRFVVLSSREKKVDNETIVKMLHANLSTLLKKFNGLSEFEKESHKIESITHAKGKLDPLNTKRHILATKDAIGHIVGGGEYGNLKEVLSDLIDTLSEMEERFKY